MPDYYYCDALQDRLTARLRLPSLFQHIRYLFYKSVHADRLVQVRARLIGTVYLLLDFAHKFFIAVLA
jgi:hypothetical protein